METDSNYEVPEQMAREILKPNSLVRKMPFKKASKSLLLGDSFFVRNFVI